MKHGFLTKGILPLMIACCVITAGSLAQTRFQNSLSLSAGAYAASGFGTNPYVGLRYNYFLPGGQYFVEASFGYGSLKSEVLETVSRAQLFDSNDLFSYEFIFAYDPSPIGYLPYFLGGVAGLNQGGQTSFAGVLGLGKRMPLGGSFGSSQFGFRYDVRDHIFSQRLDNAEPFLAHNLVFTIGLLFYF